MQLVQYPGAVITCGGIYVVHHDSGHRPDASVYLQDGFILPPCPECVVSYTLAKKITFTKYMTTGR